MTKFAIPNRRSALPLLILGLVLSGCQKSGRDKERVQLNELDLISFAVQHARSWHSVTIGTVRGQPFETSEDVFCPSDSHTITQEMDPSGKNPILEEFIQTNDTFYAREGADPWSVQPKPGNDKCTQGPMVGSEPLLTVLYRMKRTSVLRKELTAESKDGPCRLWSLMDPTNPKNSLGTVCSAELTHLPYEFHAGTIHVRYSNWNMPIVILPPEGVTDPTLPSTP